MKKMFFTLLAVVGFSTASAQQYEVKGSAPRGVLKVYLRNFEGNQVDSTFVTDGAFSFKGDADGKLYAQVSADNGRKLYVVLDGNVQVDLATEKATGTAENDIKFATVVCAHLCIEFTVGIPLKRKRSVGNQSGVYLVSLEVAQIHLEHTARSATLNFILLC